MKTYFYFSIWFFICLCGTISSEYIDKNVTILYERVGNPDDTARIVRPCPTYDLQCIRRFFHTHGKCTMAKGRVPDPFYQIQSAVYSARENVTLVLNDAVVRGLNGRVEEFYINEDTDQLVIAVDFRNFSIASPSVYFIFYRRGREPIVTYTNKIGVVFQSVVMTTVIPKINDLQLHKAEITIFSNDYIVPVVLGPSAAESSDPQVPLTVADFLDNIPLDIQELYLTDAPYYAATFIQYAICDFGLELSPG